MEKLKTLLIANRGEIAVCMTESNKIHNRRKDFGLYRYKVN